MSDYKLGDVVGDDLLTELYELRRNNKQTRDCLISMSNYLNDIVEAYSCFHQARDLVEQWIQAPEPHFYFDLEDWEIAKSTALRTALKYGQIDGDHHKAWVIDQMVRALAGENYAEWVRQACQGEDGPNTYTWDTGIAP